MDGPPPEEADFSSLPVLERILHKNWKARVSAYNDLAHTFKTSVAEDAPDFKPYIQDPAILANALRDANAVAQEQAILCACAFVQYGGKSAASAAKEPLTAAIIDKNIFGSARAGSKKAAIELSLLIVECDGSADTVFEACIQGLKSKQPKAVAGAVTTMKEIVAQFGAKTVNVKPILKTIPTIFAHADKGVRAEGTQLVQELHRWLGPALDAHLADLKPVQQKELAEAFAGESLPTQTRFTLVQQREKALQEAEAALTANEAGTMGTEEKSPVDNEPEDIQVDGYDLADPQPVLNKLPQAFYENLSSAKWKDRKELALDPLLETLRRTPRIEDANYDDLVRALAGRMTDANIACVISAAGCLECLAKGLRQDFARYKSTAISPVLERCKEKKASVTDALAAALDAIFQSVTISDIIEEITTFSKHKNPQVKEQTYRFLVRALRSTRTAPSVKTDLKPLSDALLPGLDDSYAPVRDAAAEALGTLQKALGERAMSAIIDNLDDIKKKKVLEYAAKAEVRFKVSAAVSSVKASSSIQARPAGARAPPTQAPQSPSTSDKENSRPPSSFARNTSVALGKKPPGQVPPAGLRKPPVLTSMKKQTQATVAGPSGAAKPAPASSTPSVPPASKPLPAQPLKYHFTQEEAEAQIEGVLPSTMLAELRDSVWKVRLAALEALQSWLEGEGQDVNSELIVRTLSKSPGWKESNFQVYGKMAGVFSYLSQSSSSWTRACSALTIGALSDKLGDIKLKKPAGDTLVAYAEKYSLQFVLSQAYDAISKQKAPKSQSETLLWIEQALREFGVAGLAVRELVESFKTGLKSSNAAVRTSALRALVTLRLFVGPEIKSFVQDLNPTLLTTIDTEFAKVEGQDAPQPTRTSADDIQPAVPMSKQGSQARDDALDDLFPRQDLAKLVSPSIIKGMSDSNWKARKEALESVQAVLTANSRLKPNMGELGSALKLRLPDSNKVVQALALDVIARLAAGINKPFERFAKSFVGPICGILSDAKVNVRAPAVAALDAIYEQCGLECMLQPVGSSLEVVNPVQRHEVLSWLGRKLSNDESMPDLTVIIGPVISCLEDRSTEVRKSAQAILPNIISSTGYQPLLDKAGNLKPASRSTIIPLLETAKSLCASSGPASSSSSRPSSAAASRATSEKPTSIAQSTMAFRPQAAVSRNLKQTSVTGPRMDSPKSILPGSRLHTAPEAMIASPRSRRVVNATPASILVRDDAVDASREPIHSQLFLTSDASAKSTRASKEIGPLRWAVEGSPRPDQVDYLQQQCLPHVSRGLLGLMFSRDHHSEQDHLAALDMLRSAAEAATYDEANVVASQQEETRRQMIANSDLILKYMSLRLCDNSTSSILSTLALTEAVTQLMLMASYHLTDYEAHCYLPTFVAKLGDNKEAIRTRARTIIRSLSSIYPSSKVFSIILEQASRNTSARVRSECLEELAIFLQRQGVGVCYPHRAIPEIATFLSDKDAGSRLAALNALAEAYAQIGDRVLEYIGELPPKEQTLLEERLKRTESPSSPKPTKSTGGVTPKRSNSQQSLSRPESRAGSSKPQAVASRLPSSTSTGRRTSLLPGPLGASTRHKTQLPSSTEAYQKSAVSMSKTLSSQNWVTEEAMPRHGDGSVSLEATEPFSSIRSRDIAESVDALKRLQKTIASNPESLKAHASSLVDAVSGQMAFAFEGLNEDTPQNTLRLCKHLMQTLSAFFDQRSLSLAVPKATLATLLAELTKRLLETAASAASEAIVSLSKVLNMVLIRIFHNSDNSACFGSLFLLLERLTLDLRDLQGEELASRAKYAELVMKCLWKISKSVKDNLEDGSLDAKKLLLDIDRFLQAIPPAEWRRRASDNIPLADMPLRTVKTILQQVVSTYGEAVYDELALLERAESSFVYQYLFRLLNNSRTVPAVEAASPALMSRQSSTISHTSVSVSNRHVKEGTEDSRPSSQADVKIVSAGMATVSPARSNDIEMNLALKEIFDKIGNAQESKKGIAELYEFKKQHPEAEARINTWIAATGSFFQSYLRRALSNLAGEEAERAGLRSAPSSPQGLRPSSYVSPTDLSSLPDASHERLSNRASDADYPSPARNGSRVSSGAGMANDEKLDSLKEMFGVSRLSVAKP